MTIQTFPVIRNDNSEQNAAASDLCFAAVGALKFRHLIVLLGVLCAFAVLFATQARGQEFPSRPIKVEVIFPAGAATDILARAFSEGLSSRIKQPVLVENRAGAGGRIATEYVLRQPADGYTLLFAAPPHVTNPALYPSLPYDTEKDFAAVMYVADHPALLTANSESEFRNLVDLIRVANAKPGQPTYGSPGHGSGLHLVMVELLEMMAGVSMRHVPFKGDAPSVTALLGKHIDASLNGLSSGLPHVRAGRLRALGIATRERSPLLPEVATFVEQGYPDAVANTWFGLVARAGTPREVIAKLNAESNAALALPEVRNQFAANGFFPVGGTPEKLGAHITREIERWNRVVKTRGIKID